jgi:hypothetical protein
MPVKEKPYIKQRNPEIGEDQVLEALRLVEERLTDPDVTWAFAEWPACTCGHVYAATVNESPYSAYVAFAKGESVSDYSTRPITHPEETDGLYEEVLRAIARANKLEVVDGSDLAHVVSDATKAMAGKRDPSLLQDVYNPQDISAAYVEREDGLKLIRKTIKKILRKQEKARLKLLADQA